MHLKKKKERKKKGGKRSRKDEAQARSVLSLSVVLAVQIDCESSRMYEHCDHIMDQSMGRE